MSNLRFILLDFTPTGKGLKDMMYERFQAESKKHDKHLIENFGINCDCSVCESKRARGEK